MTKSELEQLVCLDKEIRLIQRRIRELEGQLFGKVKRHDTFLGGPFHCITEDMEAELLEQRECLEKLKRECIREQLRLTKYIYSIPDSMIRQIFTCRYFYGMNWTKTGHMLGTTPDSARMLLNRWLVQHKGEPYCPEEADSGISV